MKAVTIILTIILCFSVFVCVLAPQKINPTHHNEFYTTYSIHVTPTNSTGMKAQGFNYIRLTIKNAFNKYAITLYDSDIVDTNNDITMYSDGVMTLVSSLTGDGTVTSTTQITVHNVAIAPDPESTFPDVYKIVSFDLPFDASSFARIVEASSEIYDVNTFFPDTANLVDLLGYVGRVLASTFQFIYDIIGVYIK